MKTVDVVMPTIHLNGTSGDALLKAVQDAGVALNVALTALQETAPNARDYYVQADPKAFTHASNDHEKRLGRLEAVQCELEALAEGIYDQQLARGK
jgi:hypothetical protein